MPSEYRMSDGDTYTIWIAELHTMRRKRIVVETRYAFRVSTATHLEEVPATVAMKHVRAGTLPRSPDLIREATGAEVSWYFRHHPYLLHKTLCTDTRFSSLPQSL